MAHTTTAVPAPSSLVAGIDPALDELVRWSTDRRREARYDDAAAFAWALDAALPEGPRPLAPALLAEAGRDRVEALAAEERRAPSTTTRVVGDPARDRHATVIDDGDTIVRAERARGFPDDHGPTVAMDRTRERPMHDDEDEDELHGRRRSRRGARVLLVLGALAAAAAMLLASPSSGLGTPAWLTGLLDGALGATVDAPDQRGEPVDLAVARLEALGLEVAVAADRVNDAGVPAGHVLAQDPIGTTRAGRTVSLVVSAGPRRTTVPTPPSDTIAEVVAELERAGLVAVVVTRPDEDVEEGRLIGLDPPPGTAIDEGSRVSVLVSTGPPPVTVPRVVGLSVSEASEALRAVGLELDVSERRFDASPALTVLSQSPDASAEVPRGTTVLVVISDGPAPVTVPNLRGSTVGEALDILAALGLRAEVVRRGGAAARLEPDRVYDQDPGPGAVLRPGDTVIIYAYDA
jgi:serine/threonine-protein kinase